MKSYGIRSSNDLQLLNLNIGHRDSSLRIGLRMICPNDQSYLFGQ